MTEASNQRFRVDRVRSGGSHGAKSPARGYCRSPACRGRCDHLARRTRLGSGPAANEGPHHHIPGLARDLSPDHADNPELRAYFDVLRDTGGVC
jgi:hypothetical protein